MKATAALRLAPRRHTEASHTAQKRHASVTMLANVTRASLKASHEASQRLPRVTPSVTRSVTARPGSAEPRPRRSERGAHPVAFAQRVGRYGLVGASGVGVNMGVFWLLNTQLHAHYLVAGPIAIQVALLSNYLLNNNWTFADRRHGLLSPSSFLRYQVVSLGGLAINLLVLHVLAGSVAVPAVVANLAGIGVATAWNFVLSLGWTWAPSGTRVALAR